MCTYRHIERDVYLINKKSSPSSRCPSVHTCPREFSRMVSSQLPPAPYPLSFSETKTYLILLTTDFLLERPSKYSLFRWFYFILCLRILSFGRIIFCLNYLNATYINLVCSIAPFLLRLSIFSLDASGQFANCLLQEPSASD